MDSGAGVDSRVGDGDGDLGGRAGKRTDLDSAAVGSGGDKAGEFLAVELTKLTLTRNRVTRNLPNG